jgi:hypothetical protein
MALLQFGTTLVFAVPPLWQNPNQPDPNLRKAQAIMGKESFIFCHLLSFLIISCHFPSCIQRAVDSAMYLFMLVIVLLVPRTLSMHRSCCVFH